MAKRRVKPNRKGVKPRQKKKAMAVSSVMLDQAALSYAKLLADPCSGPLVHPVYPGSDAGFLFRAESFVTFGNGAASTSGCVHWTPGYVNSTLTELLTNSATGSGFASAFAVASDSPGRAFLASNAKGVRCVAACLKVSYPGAEGTRSGRVHYGLTQAGMIDTGNLLSPDGVAQALQHYGRTPTDTIELVWKPAIADTEFNDPSEGAVAQIRDRKSSLTVAWAGLPAATGLTFHFTAVYEWTPTTGLGVGHNALGKSRSRSTLDNVVDYLIAGGFKFVNTVAAGVAEGAVGGLLSRVERGFGLMPAVPRSRNLITYA